MDRVHVLGRLPRPVALAVVGRAELVVLPSLWEGFGFVAVEALALALGRAVVASSGSGFGEIITSGRDGWLVPPGDARALYRGAIASRPSEGFDETIYTRGYRRFFRPDERGRSAVCTRRSATPCSIASPARRPPASSTPAVGRGASPARSPSGTRSRCATSRRT